MDIQAYIESGILERYALGDCSEKEKIEVETLATTYPEIQKELNDIQEGLELLAKIQAKTPPASLKTEILSSIEAADISKKTMEEEKVTKIKDEEKKNINWGQLMLYVVVAGVAIWSLYRNVNTQTAQNSLNQQMQLIRDSLQTQKANLIAELEKCETRLLEITAANNNRILMAGTDNYPNQQAVIFWNSESSTTRLMNLNLEQLAENQNYQLWAIVEGKPVDLGVLDSQSMNDFVVMKSVEKPEAFAITIEPKGGSKNPTMDQMVVLGKVS